MQTCLLTLLSKMVTHVIELRKKNKRIRNNFQVFPDWWPLLQKITVLYAIFKGNEKEKQ